MLGVYPVNILLGISVVVGGVLALITLIIIDVLLGIYIYFGLREILRARKNADIYYPADKTESRPEMISEAKDGELCLVGARCGELMQKKLDSVSAEVADKMMNDESAALMIVRSEETLPMARERKKGFINVDTISESYEAGETVTLDNLKEKGLIPKNAVCVKVLARGIIDKPLCVKAQGFSANAVKMIALTGGTAVLVERRQEQN